MARSFKKILTVTIDEAYRKFYLSRYLPLLRIGITILNSQQ